MPTPAALAKLAMAGDLTALHIALAKLPRKELALATFRYLWIARDYRHRAAKRELDALMAEAHVFTTDNLGTRRGAEHWRLGSDYLTGKRGLPHDFKRGAKHLREARRLQYPWTAANARKLVDELFARCPVEDRLRLRSVLGVRR